MDILNLLTLIIFSDLDAFLVLSFFYYNDWSNMAVIWNFCKTPQIIEQTVHVKAYCWEVWFSKYED